MRSRFRWLLVVFGLLLAGCGSGGSSSTHVAPVLPTLQSLQSGPLLCDPAPGEGVMGACTPFPKLLTPGLQKLSVSGSFCPDVSEFQRDPDWAAAKRAGLRCAIVRVADMIAGHADRSLAYNARALTRLHVWHAFYAFLRPGDCTGEAKIAVRYVDAVGGLHSGPLVADGEVALPARCIGDFTRELRKLTGWNVGVDYSSRGTYPGGADSRDLQWDAAYGPKAECFFSPCRRVAWQLTDGVIGPEPHCVAGLCGDISRDEGLTRLVRPVKESRVQVRAREKRKLLAHYRLRKVLRRDVARHTCQTVAKPASYREDCVRWLGHLRVEARIIGEFHEKVVF